MEITLLANSKWIDIWEPQPEDILTLSKAHSLPPTAIEDSLEPEHLPKYEKFSGYDFVIFRAYDDRCKNDADTVHELTRKVAVFFNNNTIITIHRLDQKWISDLREKLSRQPVSVHDAFLEICQAAIASYQKPIDQSLFQFEELENRVFKTSSENKILKEGYLLRRKASVKKRMLRLTMEILTRLNQNGTVAGPLYQDTKDYAENLFFFSDEILDNVNNLLSLKLALEANRTNEASHRANEVMRVLTLFSVFFLPLNFIASIYGMNFENIPELKQEYGYPMTLTIMAVIALLIAYWFYNKGWLKKII